MTPPKPNEPMLGTSAEEAADEYVAQFGQPYWRREAFLAGYQAAIKKAEDWCNTPSRDIETGQIGVHNGIYFPAYDLVAYLKDLPPEPTLKPSSEVENE